MSYLRFGAFIAPHHLPVNQNITLSLQRDTELTQHLDDLGFDEAWFGEHHSGGCEPIGDPMMMIAHVAQVTQRIKLGTGVVSLPYHNPLWVADRFVLLDHLTRGRAMLGVGPGALATDAKMIGLDPKNLRDALEQDVQVLMHLLTSQEPISIETDRYTLVDARLQLDNYTYPHPEVATAAIVSPSGPRLAGRNNLGMISIGATLTSAGFDALAYHWDVVEEQAAAHGNTANRDSWRLVGMMHLADTKDQAIADVRYGLSEFCDYLQHTASTPQMQVTGEDFEGYLEWVVDGGVGVVGTWQEAVDQIQRLWDQSNGGFGCYLNFDQNWADFAQKKHSYELMANHVMPHFQGGSTKPRSSEAALRSVRDPLAAEQWKAIEDFTARHAAERAVPAVGVAGS